MKKYLPLMIVGIVVVAAIAVLFAFKTESSAGEERNVVAAGDKVEVFYFHFTRRCVTCQAVEDESKKAIEALYPEEVKKGTVSFKGVNLDEESSKPVAERCKVTGQSLLIVSGEARIDLTSEGFMYAKSNPDKLKEELKKTIDPLLKGNK
jgi:hypothetical protein